MVGEFRFWLSGEAERARKATAISVSIEGRRKARTSKHLLRVFARFFVSVNRSACSGLREQILGPNSRFCEESRPKTFRPSFPFSTQPHTLFVQDDCKVSNLSPPHQAFLESRERSKGEASMETTALAEDGRVQTE